MCLFSAGFHLAGLGSNLLFFFRDDADMNFLELLFVHFVRALVHRADGEGILREGDHFLYGSFAGHQHDEPVETGGYAAMGRGAVLKGIDEESELFLRFFSGKSDDLENAVLQVGIVDSDGARGDFEAVEVRDNIRLPRLISKYLAIGPKS